MADREVTAGFNPGEVNKAFYSVQHWRKLLTAIKPDTDDKPPRIHPVEPVCLVA